MPWDWRDVSSTLDVHYIRFVNATYDGEGEFVFPGPPSSRYSGLLPTLQLEGMRDGLVRNQRLSTLEFQRERVGPSADQLRS